MFDMSTFLWFLLKLGVCALVAIILGLLIRALAIKLMSGLGIEAGGRIMAQQRYIAKPDGLLWTAGCYIAAALGLIARLLISCGVFVLLGCVSVPVLDTIWGLFMRML